MPHFPKPFFKKARGLWYVQIDRRQVNLGPNRDEAFRRYHELMTNPSVAESPTTTIVPIIEAFLDWTAKHRAPDTYEWYRYRLQRFVDRYPRLTLNELKPYHVQQWVDSYDLSRTSKRNYLRSIKRCLAWAVKQGYLDKSPIEHLEVPAAESKNLVISQAEFNDLLNFFSSNPEFCELLVVTWETGCRPQESLRVEARHVDIARSRWVFPQSEGKTGVRIVYLSDAALQITKRRMQQFPSGKLFRNSRGNAWTTEAVNCRFYTYRVKTGRRFSLYAMRHSWATHALERGIDPLTVAILLGHKDPSMLARVYQHLAHNPEHLLRQARRAITSVGDDAVDRD